eukprot:8000327-Ditylum_brightwellii.AAC.2
MPQHDHAIQLIEHIVCVDKKNFPVFIISVVTPELIHDMDLALYARAESSTELLSPAGLCYSIPTDK